MELDLGAGAVHHSSNWSLPSVPPTPSSRRKGVGATLYVPSKASFLGMAYGAQSQTGVRYQGIQRVDRYYVLKVFADAGDGTGAVHASTEDRHMNSNDQAERGGPVKWFRNTFQRRSAQKEELVDGLKRYGVAGVLSYGLLNTAYYLTTFLFVWFYVAPSPGGLGFVPAAKRFIKVFATVWAGSQVTKLLRAAGALSLAPFVDKGLNWYTQRFNFESRGKAFSFLVIACFGLAALVFLIITTLWS